MNQDYRDKVKRHLEAGGDPKYVNVKRKADARHAEDKKKDMAGKMKGDDKQRFVNRELTKALRGDFKK